MFASLVSGLTTGVLKDIFLGLGGTALLVIAINKVWLLLLSREKTIQAGYDAGKKAAERLAKLDIPVVKGQIEETVKTRLKTTVGDYSFGFTCGLHGLDVKELHGLLLPPESPKSGSGVDLLP